MKLRNKRAAQGAVAATGAAVAAIATGGPASAGTVPLTIQKAPSSAMVAQLSQRDLGMVLESRVRLVHEVADFHIDVGGCLACGLGGFDDRFIWDDPVIDPDPYKVLDGGLLEVGGLDVNGLDPAQLDLGGLGPVGP